MSLLQVIDETNGNVITGFDINVEKKLKKGWHNFIVTCDNKCPDSRGRVTFYFNGNKYGDSQACLCFKPIGFIGNSKNGAFPFGTVCDLRVYPYLLKNKQIDKIATYHPELEFEMMDKYQVRFVENALLSGLINDMKNYSRPNIIIGML